MVNRWFQVPTYQVLHRLQAQELHQFLCARKLRLTTYGRNVHHHHHHYYYYYYPLPLLPLAPLQALAPPPFHTEAAAAVPGWGALREGAEPGAETLGRHMGRLCGRREALGLLWHTVRGLLGGLEGAVGASGEALRPAARPRQSFWTFSEADAVKLTMKSRHIA